MGLTHTSEMTYSCMSLGTYTCADWYGGYLGLKTHLVATAKASHLLAAVSVPTQGSQLRVGPESMDKPSPLFVLTAPLSASVRSASFWDG